MRNDKGVRAEWELRKILTDSGAIVVRGAGSHCIDLVAVWAGSVWAVEVKSTSKTALNVGSGAYLREQLYNTMKLSLRIPTYYAVRFGEGSWRWYVCRDGMCTILRESEGMTLEQARGYV
jgi:Holliday junction resolvase